MDNKKEIIKFFLSRDILINKEIIDKIYSNNISLEEFYNSIKDQIQSDSFLILDRHIQSFLDSKKEGLNWKDYDKSVVLAEKGDNSLHNKFKNYMCSKNSFKQKINNPNNNLEQVKIISSYNEEPKKRTVQDFVNYFNKRFDALENILKNRSELQNLISIKRVKQKKDKDNLSIIGLVNSKNITKNGNIILNVEDKTDSINILINKNKPELFNYAKDIVPDEVIGVVGVNGENIIFANNLLWPDVPSNKTLKKSDDESYAIFLSDIHIGSNTFLMANLNKFIDWINCKVGSENQKNIANKIKYIFIIGDLVDGCGIYPGQEEELIIKDIYGQYEEAFKFLKKIPSHINIIISPGNHDALRIAEPQPVLYKDYAKSLWELPNIYMVSNPSLVNIHSSSEFSGFDVLLYHGYSFDYYVANVESIRQNGGYDRADLIMKFLLKRRHLAPTHTSTLYIPDVNKDPLVINKIPDFFVTGHIHKTSVTNHKNTTLICGSCWQSITSFQEKVGHHPEPCRVPIVNLNTREVKIMRF
jgi:DNA polymerase II small subunit